MFVSPQLATLVTKTACYYVSQPVRSCQARIMQCTNHLCVLSRMAPRKTSQAAPSKHDLATSSNTSRQSTRLVSIPSNRSSSPLRPRYKELTPHINPKMFGSSGDMNRLREELSEARHRDSYCHLCSEDGAVYHPHFSTQYMREFASKYRSGRTYHCPMCKKEEPHDLPENVTRRLILASSILYNVWESPNLQVNQHIDIEAIVGGRVRDLTRALQHMYLSKPHRLEIIAMVSINNIGEGQEPERIIKEMQDMKEMVEGHSQYYKHDPPSYVSFATCILPPKFCSVCQESQTLLCGSPPLIL